MRGWDQGNCLDCLVGERTHPSGQECMQKGLIIIIILHPLSSFSFRKTGRHSTPTASIFHESLSLCLCPCPPHGPPHEFIIVTIPSTVVVTRDYIATLPGSRPSPHNILILWAMATEHPLVTQPTLLFCPGQ